MRVSLQLLACVAAFALDPPSGWKETRAGGAGVYTPVDLQPSEFVQVIAYPRTSLGTASLEAWLASAAGQENLPEGRWTAALSVKPQTKNLVSGARAWIDASGKQGAAIYTAVSVDGLQGRYARLLMNASPAMQRHRNAALELMSALAAEEMAAAKEEQRATDLEAQPPAVAHLKPGGPLAPGRYVGNLASAGKVLRRVDLLLFPNGEYEYVSGASSSGSTKGKLKYTPATGKLDTSEPCWNSTYHPDEDFCLFGRNAQGAYVIYAEDYYGVGTFKTLLTRVGDVDRLPPTQAEAKLAAEQAEARRYKFVTAPGQGLAPAEIEAIVYRWEQVYEIGGLQLRDYAYLLLKDGTAHQGVPVAPEDMDAGASKRNEPKQWGRWRRNGTAYEFAWADAPQQFRAPGNTSAAQPAKANARMEGHWQSSSSYAIAGGAAAWSFWGVRFTRDGRFERYRTGGAGSGMMGELSGSGVTSGVVYNDEGSASSVSAPNFGGGATRKTGTTKADRSGTYTLQGYTLELRYDNGVVSRLPFFVSGDSIWFDGAMMSREKPKAK